MLLGGCGAGQLLGEAILQAGNCCLQIFFVCILKHFMSYHERLCRKSIIVMLSMAASLFQRYCAKGFTAEVIIRSHRGSNRELCCAVSHQSSKT